jgi:CspA family cold shock protein
VHSWHGTIGRNPVSLFTKLIVSLVIAAIAATLTSIMKTGEVFDLWLFVAFVLATAATALLVRDGTATSASPSVSSSSTGKVDEITSDNDTAREYGKVKWFNISKGFGFIIKEDGEEIFVHFRSIRGEGRRGLRDGQDVSFVVAESDKGPQAEDVVGED